MTQYLRDHSVPNPRTLTPEKIDPLKSSRSRRPGLRGRALVILHLLGSGATGCGAAIQTSTHGSAEVLPSIPTLDFPKIKEAPFELKVLSDAREQSDLRISGEITGKTVWNPGAVAIRSRIFVQGETVQSLTMPLLAYVEKGLLESRTSDGVLDANEALPFTVSIPVTEMTDYMLEVLWGENAVAALRPPVTLSVDELVRQQPPCDDSPCPFHLLVKATLSNLGDIPISKVKVSVGLVQRETIPPVEADPKKAVVQELVVPSQVLPGRTRKLSFRFGGLYQEADLRTLAPHLTLLEVDSHRVLSPQ